MNPTRRKIKLNQSRKSSSKWLIYLLLNSLMLAIAEDSYCQVTTRAPSQNTTYHSIDNSNKIERPNSSIEVCDFQTTHLVFESDVVYIDIGNPQKYIFDYTNNIVRLKGEKTASSTNLTVITSDNNFYSFYVSYAARPRLNYFVYSHSRLHQIIDTSIHIREKGEQSEATQVAPNILDNTVNAAANHETYEDEDSNPTPFPTLAELEQNPSYRSKTKIKDPIQTDKQNGSVERTNPSVKKVSSIIETEGNIYDEYHGESYESSITQTAEKIIAKSRMYSNIKARHGRNGKVTLRVTGIYHSLDHAFIKYEVENFTSIPYDIDYVEFGIVETKKPRRTALTEEKLDLIKVLNADMTRVLPMRIQRYVAILPKLAVPEDRTLYMEIVEEGRNIYLPIPYNRIKIERIKVY